MEQLFNTTNPTSLAQNGNLSLLKDELIAVWAYMTAYVELFDHPDPKRMSLLLKSAPGFFALIQSALLETVLFGWVD